MVELKIKGMNVDILKKVVELSGQGKARLTVITAATVKPLEAGQDYVRVFTSLGVKDVVVLDIKSRQDAQQAHIVERIKKSTGIFFTGGDQLRITSLLGGSPVYRALYRAYKEGVLVCGTSAGASAMTATMVVEGDDNETLVEVA